MDRRLFVFGAATVPFASLTLARIPQGTPVALPKYWQVIDRKMVGPSTCALNFNRKIAISKDAPIGLRARLNGLWLDEISVVDASGNLTRAAVKRNLPPGVAVSLRDLFGHDVAVQSVGLRVTCLPLQYQKTGVEILAWR